MAESSRKVKATAASDTRAELLRPWCARLQHGQNSGWPIMAEVIQWIGWSILGLVALAVAAIVYADRWFNRPDS